MSISVLFIGMHDKKHPYNPIMGGCKDDRLL